MSSVVLRQTDRRQFPAGQPARSRGQARDGKHEESDRRVPEHPERALVADQYSDEP
jgi:hypothetical protein